MATPIDSEGGVSPEIARLSAQLAKDPGSKLFMPLAEEYLKAGMVTEAVSALENGLNANPYYMSAKVLLGKAYLQNGDTGKAKEQFEAVVKAIPDNLLAHRKLGEIYLGMGMMAEAVRSFKIITLLNPKDEEAKALLKEAESPRAASSEEPGEDKPTGAQAEDAAPEPSEIAAFDISEISQTEEEPEPETEIPLPEDRFAAAYEIPEPEPEFPTVEIDDLHTAPDVFSKIEAMPEPHVLPETDALPEPEEEIEAEAIPETVMEGEAEEPMPAYSIDATQTDVEDIFSACKEVAAEDESHENPAGVYEITDDLSSFELDGFVYQAPKEQAPPAAPKQAPPETGRKEVFETETLAELYVAQGFYDRAINIYKNLIVESPSDMSLKQKLEDLYLLANIGKKGQQEEAEVLDADLAGEILPPWEDESPEPDAMDSWEFYGESGKRMDESGEPPRHQVRSKNLEAVERLEGFLETIRRKAGK